MVVAAGSGGTKGSDLQAMVEAASGGQCPKDAAGGKGDWFGLRQERLVEGDGGSEQRRHQGMDVMCGKGLGSAWRAISEGCGKLEEIGQNGMFGKWW